MFLTLALFLSLADDRFDVREHAESELTRLVNERPHIYGSRLAALAPLAADAETRRRVAVPLRAFDAWRAASYVPSGVPVWPICDAYPIEGYFGSDWRDRVTLAPWLSIAWHEPQSSLASRPEAERAGPRWYCYRRATELWARNQIAEGATPAYVDSTLVRMWKIEVAAKSDCGACLECGSKWMGGYPLTIP